MPVTTPPTVGPTTAAIACRLAAAAMYEPCWESNGRRVTGPDEDALTMAVAAARALDMDAPPERAVLVSDQIDSIPTSAPAVLGAALDVSGAVELRRGGAAATVEALISAAVGTIVIAVEVARTNGAAAIRIGDGDVLRTSGRHRSPLPLGAAAGVLDDARLERDRALRPAVAELAATCHLPVVLAGLEPRTMSTLGSSPVLAPLPVEGAPAPIFAIAGLARAQSAARLIALETGTAVAVDLPVLSQLALARASRTSALALPDFTGGPADIPISLSAFDRAFEAKVGFRAARCGSCGELSFPPRPHCLVCGSDAGVPDELVPLPRRGEVYSVVTIHAAVPGKASPYSLAVVTLAGTPLRVLAPVTDAIPGGTPIGTAGDLVLRRAATRQGVPDYGFAFQPDEPAEA